MCGFNFKKALYKKLLKEYESQLVDAIYVRRDWKCALGIPGEAKKRMRDKRKQVENYVMRAVYITAGEFIEKVANTPLKESQLTDKHKRDCFRKHDLYGDSEDVHDSILVNEFLTDEKSKGIITDYLEQRGLPPELDINHILDGKFNKHVIATYRDFLKNKRFRLYNSDKEIFGNDGNENLNVYMFPWQYLQVADTSGGDCDDKAVFLTRAITVPFENSSSVSPEDLRKVVMPMIHLIAGHRGGGQHLQPIFLDNKNLMTHRIAEPTIGVPQDFDEQRYYQNLLLRLRTFTGLPKVYHSSQSVSNIYLAFDSEKIWGKFDPEPSKDIFKDYVEKVTFNFTPTFEL